ncbi:MAG: ATP-binding protein [Burkholderiales bacterium]|nr:ATP-binding protein [Burkholderiales bacterium]
MNAPSAAATRVREQGWTRRETTPESFWISLRYFNLYRIMVAGLFLAASLYYEESLNLGSHGIARFRTICIWYLVFGIVFHGVLRNLRDHFNLQLSLHVSLDIVAITLLMHASGGLRSGLGVMLLISLIAAALVAPRRLTYLYAAMATIALLLEQTYWTLVTDAPTANYLQPGMLAIGYFASAGVTNWLAQRVATNERLARQRGRELETQVRVNQRVIEEMHEGVLVLDGDGRVVQHNPQAQRLLGLDAVRGADLEQVVPGFARLWADWQAGGIDRSPSADVTVRGREVRLRVLDAGTEDDFSVLSVEDLSRSREQAQQLKLAALGRLTANIAHEIRNPLSAISHAAELLAEEKRGPDRVRLSRIINDNAHRLERLVADVLQLNRRDRIATDRIHLNAWLVEFLEEYVANESIPPERFVLQSARECWVNFDREHLRQVLWNLLRNAVRYSPPVPRSVRIVLGGYANQVELSVIDAGPGVSPADQGNLFEPFFTTDSKGTGLGLYLARELCAANGASLEYVDERAGAHFRILCAQAHSA